MNDQQPEEWTVSYGLGYISEDGLKEVPDGATELPDGTEGVHFAMQIPCAIAYEIGWGLALYATALTEWATSAEHGGGETEQNEAEAMTERGQFMFTLAQALRDGSKRGLMLLGEEEPPPYPVQMPADKQGESNDSADK
jgi:hypothetical protein